MTSWVDGMIAVDVNLLVYAHRAELPQHERALRLIEELRRGEAPWAAPGEVLSGVLRLVTNPRVFRTPTPLDEALAFVRALVRSPSFVLLQPTSGHLERFLTLCQRSHATGKLVPDAWLAAIAMEHGCTWWSCDPDFARFEGLEWVNPLRTDLGGSS